MNFTIGSRRIGDGEPVFFIAEAGVNHNGALDLAYKLVDTAVAAGADAVKFQTFKAEKLNTRNAPKSSYHVETTGSDAQQTWFELLKTQELDEEMHSKLIDYCAEKGITFLSTPYDEDSADLLERLGVKAFKLASTDTNNIPLIRHIARKGKPFIISTAMCDMEEVELAVQTIREEGLQEFAVLQCTGNYPSQLEDSNLHVMTTYREGLACLVGYSDHTPGIINPIAATAMGAAIVEKHFTYDKSLPGPDHRMSLAPKELRETVAAIRQTEQALGSREKRVLPSEQENRGKLRKSLVAAKDIKKGTELTSDCVIMKRPGIGIPPSALNRFLRQRAKVDIAADEILSEEMFD
jgi:N,N'-diacetyllegionaminate synthase